MGEHRVGAVDHSGGGDVVERHVAAKGCGRGARQEALVDGLERHFGGFLVLAARCRESEVNVDSCR